MNLETAAENFVRETLQTAAAAPHLRSVLASAMLEAAGALARQDAIEDPTRRSFYAEALKTLADHVLGPGGRCKSLEISDPPGSPRVTRGFSPKMPTAAGTRRF